MKNKSIAKLFDLDILATCMHLRYRSYQSVKEIHYSVKFATSYLRYAVYEDIYGKYKNE